jgi:small conductance mechanosensitive channel
LVVAWVASSWLRRLIKNGTYRARLDPTLGSFFANAARWGVLTLGVVTCLGVFGVQTASFAAVIAALGLAIALAFQGTLSNIASGVLLLVFRPFKVGDSVVIAGVAGVVNEIDLFTTALDTADGRRVIVPNAQIAGAVIDNQSHHPRRRFEVLLSVNFDADPSVTEAALSRALRVLEGKPGYLSSPPPEVAMTDFGKASVGWAVRYWATREVGGVHRPELLAAIKQELDREGITLAAT